MKSPNEIVLSLFAENHGYLLSRELGKKSSLYVELRTLLDKGIVEKIKPGLYKHIDFPPQNELIEVAKIYPQGIFCLYSAWHYYELTDHVPYLHHLAFPNKVKMKLIDYPPVKPYFWINPLLCLYVIQFGILEEICRI